MFMGAALADENNESAEQTEANTPVDIIPPLLLQWFNVNKLHLGKVEKLSGQPNTILLGNVLGVQLIAGKRNILRLLVSYGVTKFPIYQNAVDRHKSIGQDRDAERRIKKRFYCKFVGWTLIGADD
jgi:hypothetical protein